MGRVHALTVAHAANMPSNVEVDSAAAIRFLNIANELRDSVAVFLKSYETGRVAQRVGPVSWLGSERFLGWLRAMNARNFNVFVQTQRLF